MARRSLKTARRNSAGTVAASPARGRCMTSWNLCGEIGIGQPVHSNRESLEKENPVPNR